jgi:hypothetical protein
MPLVTTVLRYRLPHTYAGLGVCDAKQRQVFPKPVSAELVRFFLAALVAHLELWSFNHRTKIHFIAFACLKEPSRTFSR